MRSMASINAWVMQESDVKQWWTKELEIRSRLETNTRRRKGPVRVEDLEVDGLPCAVDTPCFHVSSFVSLKDAMRG
ncbi:hypothetical protein C1H46_016395 [Malus baccata]|uniref:Uncharacterized protein n=1 Tax=Malus baccata TaxID=106549 RepID=A0A540MH50_MALBA|nr:hypothetical protein C1H46_016395 [Malus baccata]